jgi:CheY-like chemotaxis protein
MRFAAARGAALQLSNSGRAAGHVLETPNGLMRCCGMNATREAQDYSILIADDDRRCREALREIMEPAGYHTLLAACGEEAVDIVRGGGVHLILLDMHMPTLTGLETLQLVHQINSLLPAILVTADASASLLLQAYQAHAYSVIPKPVSKNVVLYTVVRALSRVYGPPQPRQQ